MEFYLATFFLVRANTWNDSCSECLVRFEVPCRPRQTRFLLLTAGQPAVSSGLSLGRRLMNTPSRDECRRLQVSFATAWPLSIDIIPFTFGGEKAHRMTHSSRLGEIIGRLLTENVPVISSSSFIVNNSLVKFLLHLHDHVRLNEE